MTTDRFKQTNDDFFGSAHESTEELAKLYEGRGNFSQAELVLEEAIALSSRSKQIQEGPEVLGESVDGTVERLVDHLSRLYLLFKQRIKSMGFDFYIEELASETIISRAARIDIDHLWNRLYQDNLITSSDSMVWFIAATHNACNLAQCYLARRGSVERTGFGVDALHMAIEHGSYDYVKLLIARGADVNAEGMTSLLFIAAKRGSICIIVYLLSKGAKIEAQNPAGETPLLAAIKNNNPEAVQYLLDQGANVNAQDYPGFTALHHAAVSQSVDILKTLLQYK
ncbi:MAG: hypothetical protein Q9181_007931, partial [Wetmoreana brouardii]